MSNSGCRHVTLSKNTIAHVQHCTECSCVSLHLGHVTLRLDPRGLEALWEVLGDAVNKLDAHTHVPPTTYKRGVA